jgi:hypothetical protein
MRKGSREITLLKSTVRSSRFRNPEQENPMNAIHYIGFDVHKKTIAYCVKTADGQIVEEGTLRIPRADQRENFVDALKTRMASLS